MRSCSHSEPGSVQVFRSASDLPAAWNALLPTGHFLQSDHLTIYEQAVLPDISFHYALIYKERVPVAAAYFQLLKLKEDHLNVNQLKPIQALVWKSFLSLVSPKILTAGHLFRHDIKSFYWNPSFAPFDAYQFYQQAINTVRRQTRAQAVLVKDMPDSLITYFRNYAPEYLLLRNDISMEMSLPPEWISIKDYEKSLKHKYAQRFRKVRQAWKDVEIKELSSDDVLQYEQPLFELYNNINTRQQVRLGHLSSKYLVLLKQRYPDLLKIWLITEKEKPIAFFSAWVDEEAFDMFYIGMDYTRNEELQLYFNILFFGIEQAILHRKTKLIFGRTALEAKARLGCKPRYLSTYIYIRNPLVRNIIFRMNQNLSSQEGEWENRHPFKPVKETEG